MRIKLNVKKTFLSLKIVKWVVKAEQISVGWLEGARGLLTGRPREPLKISLHPIVMRLLQSTVDP